MTTAKKPRGFAAMHPDHVKAIARKGGKAAHTAGTAHEFNSDEARAAGRKGGIKTHANRRAKLAQPATVSGAKDPKDDGMEEVQVGCSSASGCEGTIRVPKKGTGSAKAPTPSDDDAAVADGASADENADDMGSCGSSGCGSHG